MKKLYLMTGASFMALMSQGMVVQAADSVNVSMPTNNPPVSEYKITLSSQSGKNWTYKVEWVRGKALSHWDLSLGSCLGNVTAISGNGTKQDAGDPSNASPASGADSSVKSSKLIKWDTQGGTFTVTMDKEYQSKQVPVLAKTATVYNTGMVTGPDCTKEVVSASTAAADAAAAAAGAQANDCATSNASSGGETDYVEVTMPAADDKGSTYGITLVSHSGKDWTYKIEGLKGRTLSHWDLGVGAACLDHVTNITGGGTKQPTGDPSLQGKTGDNEDILTYPVIKWDTQGGTFTITLDGDYAAKEIPVVAKTATYYGATLTILGPDCNTPATIANNDNNCSSTPSDDTVADTSDDDTSSDDTVADTGNDNTPDDTSTDAGDDGDSSGDTSTDAGDDGDSSGDTSADAGDDGDSSDDSSADAGDDGDSSDDTVAGDDSTPTDEGVSDSSQGNPNATCPADSTMAAKFNWTDAGYAFEKPEGNETVVTISGDATAAGGSWSSSTGIRYIVLKGGTSTYILEAGTMAGSFAKIVLPTNNGGQIPDISNIQFCAGDIPPNVPPTPKQPPLGASLANVSATAIADGIRLAWTTDSETDTSGFHVWRAQKNGAGEFVNITRLTAAKVNATGSASSGASYSYLDGTAGSGTYFYAVEELSFSDSDAGTIHMEAIVSATR